MRLTVSKRKNIPFISFYRSKFRSQTSDNMDRSKAEVGRVREEKREERRSEKRKSQKKKEVRMCTKRSKSRETLCFSNDLWHRRVDK